MPIDHIEEVQKNTDDIDHIEHVEKFNPFHDRLGRFSNAQGFSSYSANPKTKAGANAINRSAAGGHGRTLNVHRESKGESIQQNARWLATGQKPKVPAATSRAQYQQRKLRQQQQQAAQAASAGQNNQAQQNTQKPSAQAQTQNQAQQTATQSKVVHVNQKMRSGSTMDVDFNQSKVAGALNKEFKGTAEGKDLTKSFDATKLKASDSYNYQSRYTNHAADMQGFNSPAKKVSQAEFDQLSKACGDEFYRTISGTTLNGKNVNAKGFKNAYTSESDLNMNGTYGGRVYGDGIYTVSAKMNAGRGKTYTAKDAADVKRESQYYGDGRTTLKMTWLSKPNIVTESKLNSEWNNLSNSEKSKFGNHKNTYACAKGYDAIYTGSSNYMVVFNRSKVAVLDD